LKRNKSLWKVLFLLPLLVYLSAFTLFPVIQSVFLSFRGKGSSHFSLSNYSWLFTHFQFQESLINTISITVLALSLELVLALSIALLLTGGGRRRIVQALILIPLGIPTIVVASNMRYLFDTNGFINQILSRLHLIDIPVNWLGGGVLTLFSVVISDMWKVTPLMMLILLAGLERIPRDLFEAARIDGSSFFQELRFIILPMLKPFIAMALIIRGIDTFRIFELPLALAGQSFKVLSSFAFFEFRNFNNPNTAAAASTVLFLIILAAIFTYIKLSGAQKETA
jgi:trehalose transport system permease protein